MNSKKQAAKNMLAYYFRLIGGRAGVAGLNWNWDNDSEVESIVDLIIEAAKEEILAELKGLKNEQ